MVSLWNLRIFKIRDVKDFSEEEQHKRRIWHLIYSQVQREIPMAFDYPQKRQNLFLSGENL